MDVLRGFRAEILRRVVEQMQTFGDCRIRLARLLVLVADAENAIDERLRNAVLPGVAQDACGLCYARRVDAGIQSAFALTSFRGCPGRSSSRCGLASVPRKSGLPRSISPAAASMDSGGRLLCSVS